VAGSLTGAERGRASAHERRWQKGGESAERGDPHHVSAVPSGEVPQARSCFGADAPCGASTVRKVSWVGKAHAFHEAPAEPVLAASSPALGAR